MKHETTKQQTELKRSISRRTRTRKKTWTEFFPSFNQSINVRAKRSKRLLLNWTTNFTSKMQPPSPTTCRRRNEKPTATCNVTCLRFGSHKIRKLIRLNENLWVTPSPSGRLFTLSRMKLTTASFPNRQTNRQTVCVCVYAFEWRASVNQGMYIIPSWRKEREFEKRAVVSYSVNADTKF